MHGCNCQYTQPPVFEQLFKWQSSQMTSQISLQWSNAFHCLGKFFHYERSSKLVVVCNVVCAGDWLWLGTTFTDWWLTVTSSWQNTHFSRVCTSLSLSSGQKHQNCSTVRTGLQAITQDVQGVEGKKETAPITMYLRRKQHKKILKHYV